MADTFVLASRDRDGDETMYRFATLLRAGDTTIPERKAILLAHSEHLKKRKADLDRCEDLLAYKLAIYDDLMGWLRQTRGDDNR